MFYYTANNSQAKRSTLIEWFSVGILQHWLLHNTNVLNWALVVILLTAYLFTFINDDCILFHRYAKGWFIIDLISSFPFDYIVSTANSNQSGRLLSASRALRILRMAKLLSLLRLLRISRLVRKIQQYEEVGGRVRSMVYLIPL